jgi:hypothetical protein
MRQLIVQAPINSLSFGQVSLNLLRELYNQKVDVILFPVGNIDIQAYDKLSKDFKAWLSNAINRRLTDVKRNIPTLKLWHFNGAHERISDRQYLLTFYECDSPTQEELNMFALQDHVFFPAKYNVETFTEAGADYSKMSVVPMGFDPDFGVLPNQQRSDKIEFGLIGKWEKRKNTSLIINSWVKKYGNDDRYCLNLAITNPFLRQEDHIQLMNQALEGKTYDNVNFLQYMKTNSEVISLMNHIDIDLGGMSSAEGWNLPSFHMTALGKWSVVLNATAHREWATDANSIQVQPTGKRPVYDNVHFQKGQPFNQGYVYSFDTDQFISAMEVAASKAKTLNTEGLKLQETHTWKHTVDSILGKIFV